MEEIKNAEIGFGKYKGELWTRLPIPYLKYLSNTATGAVQAIALSELNRRGVDAKSGLGMEITMHAVDRASQKLLNKWAAERIDDEGLATWLARTGHEAIEKGTLKNGRHEWDGISYVFKFGNIEPTLVSIYPITDQQNETENT